MNRNIGDTRTGAAISEHDVLELCDVWGHDPRAWLTRREVARLTGVSTVSQAKYANEGTGPAYKICLGRAVMRARDVAAWWLSHMSDPDQGQQARSALVRHARGTNRGGRPRKTFNATLAGLGEAA